MVAGSDRHVHGPAPGGEGTDARWLSAALALILAFMAGEVVAGVAAHSLALISDAAHMLTDAAAIALVLVTARLAARPPAGGYTYGLKRTEIMSAQANGITLVLARGVAGLHRDPAPGHAARGDRRHDARRRAGRGRGQRGGHAADRPGGRLSC
jgi:cobalt-zinc-cadmium efflux system protein